MPTEPETAPTDAELVRAAQRDPAAFDAVYRRYLTPVYRYTVARVGSAADAEDVTATVFLEALASLPRYREQGRFPAWLFTIARRQVGAHRRGGRRAPVDTTAEPADAAEGIGFAEREDLYRALEHLTDDRREALALRFFGGLAIADVAAVLGKGESATKMLVHRGLAQLRTLLTEADDG
jgi:RNA polymerase sigma-70 factor (ECF subfamily)